jgi:hypothetical protein
VSEYRNRLSVHELEPTVDWRALFVLSSFLSVAIGVAMALLSFL